MSDTEKRYLRGALSPADQYLIGTIENGHLTLADFQRKHGLTPDGIMGPETRAVVDALEEERIARAATRENPYQKPQYCTLAARARRTNGETALRRCDKGDHSSDIPHGASFGKIRVRWAGSDDGYFLINAFDEPTQVTYSLYQGKSGQAEKLADSAIRALDLGQQLQSAFSFASGGVVVNRIDGTKQIETDSARIKRAKIQGADKYTKRIEKHRASKSHVPLTRETYRTRFSEMQYTVIRAQRFGFLVIVTLARGGEWQYRRPTEAWANRTGARRLRQELRRLDVAYNRDNPTGVRAADLGIHFQMTTEELTAELSAREAEDRLRQQKEWDAEFHGEEKAS